MASGQIFVLSKAFKFVKTMNIYLKKFQNSAKVDFVRALL